MADSTPRIRWVLLVLLWAWALVIFVIVDLFSDVEEFDRIRPDSLLYQGMRSVAHEMVGEDAPVIVDPTERVNPRRTALRTAAIEKHARRRINPRMLPTLRTHERLGYVAHGTFTQWNDPDGEQAEGDYKAGRRVGRWVWNRLDGTPQEERHYERGLLHGRVASWYADGTNERVEFYAEGKRAGEWQAWYSNGERAGIDNYAAGQPHGEFLRWYDDGRQAAERRFEEGVAEGAMTIWHASGQRKLTGRFVQGQKEGRWSYFDARGNPVREEQWRDGKRVRRDGVAVARLPERK